MEGSRLMSASDDDLAPYPSPDAREAELDDVAARAGGEVRVYGESVEGRPLRVVRVPCRGRAQPEQAQRRGAPPGAAQPAHVLCAANIHGVEWIGNRVAMGLLRALSSPVGEAAALLDEADVWVAPCLNPDAYERVWRQRGVGTLKELRTNARGVDLNRNFPAPPGRRYGTFPGAGSDDPGARTYRGPSPLSEPEVSSLARLLDEVPFTASVSLHSYMGTLITPRVPSREHYRVYGELCRAFRDAQPRRRYRRFASRVVDTFTGELEDHQHHVHGTWATCVEVFPLLDSYRQHLFAPSLFWRFNPRDPGHYVDNDVPGVIGFFRAALSRGRVVARTTTSAS